MFKGVLNKMKTEINDNVNYYLELGDDFINLNQIINSKLELNFEGYQCLNCSSDIQIYRQGHCKKCFFELPSTADWVMKPELSKAHLNIEDRDLEFEKDVQLKPHILYLAYSSNVKVGVTRKSQIPYRWIDQGAINAIEIAEFPNRFLAGVSEVELKKHYADKTNWREMLKTSQSTVELENEREKAFEKLPVESSEMAKSNNFSTFKINYPVLKYPVKPKSLNIIKEKSFREKINLMDFSTFSNKKVIIKGCAGVPVPTWAYLIIVANVAQVADKIYFGEPRHAVKIFNKSN